MESRGRKRKYNNKIPTHINQDQLPSGCYWDSSARGHWYTVFFDETGRQRRKRIAGQYATLSDLHKIIEEKSGSNTNNYKWLSDLFKKSSSYQGLTKNTRQDYIYSGNLVEKHPTKTSETLGLIALSKWSTPMVQKLVDQLTSKNGASAANHALRYTKRLFRWGVNRGYIPTNYAAGVEQAVERPVQQLVSDDVYIKTLNYAKQCGALIPKTEGSAPDYIWITMEIAYLCRLRGVEVLLLTEDKGLEEGIRCDRTKGSRSNIAEWNDRLRHAWRSALDRRDSIWKAKSFPKPKNIKDRFVVVNNNGEFLPKSSFASAWQRFITRAISVGVITSDERFSLQDLKRKGTTDTKGTRDVKQEASGHKSSSMMDVYDKSVPLVKPSNT
jgi:hypothetical protein